MDVGTVAVRRRAPRFFIAIACISILVVSLPLHSHPAAAAGRQKVLFFGDSLSYEAGPYLKQDFNKRTTDDYLHLYPGTALCDWLGQIDDLTPKTAPDVVVLQFIGNHRTPCIVKSTDFIAQYGVNLRSAISKLLSIGVRDIVVDAGPTTPIFAGWSMMIATYRHVIISFDSRHILYAGAADAAVEGPAGSFATTLECLPVEVKFRRCYPGTQIKVRAKDKVHFCPMPVPAEATEVKPCPIYASGAFRYARGLARAVWTLDPGTNPNVTS